MEPVRHHTRRLARAQVGFALPVRQLVGTAAPHRSGAAYTSHACYDSASLGVRQTTGFWWEGWCALPPTALATAHPALTYMAMLAIHSIGPRGMLPEHGEIATICLLLYCVS